MMTYKISDEEYKKIDFKKIYSVASEIVALSRYINAFPFKVKEIIKEYSDIQLCSFKKAAVKYGVDIRNFGSESAVIHECDGMYIIFYNQDEKDYRIRFSIIHEFGHYILKHKMNLKQDDELYQRQEIEANCFAAQVLMPEQIIRECSNRGYSSSIENIKRYFDVSDDAAEKRRVTLSKTNYEWKSRTEKEFDDIILFKFQDYINEVAPKKLDFYNFEEEYEIQQERDSWYGKDRW